MTIRPAVEGDAQACVAILREVLPHVVTNERAWLHRGRATPERDRLLRLVAEVDGDLAGWGQAGLTPWLPTGNATMRITVTAARRREGVGATLYDGLAEHLRARGVTRVAAYFHETAEATRFAAQRGFSEIRADVPSVVDPTTVDVSPPPDVELQPLSTLDPRDVYRVDAETLPDVPYVEPLVERPYEEWLETVWRSPTFAAEGSFGALVDGELAAFAAVFADLESGRAMNGFTATRRAYRGRGLARAVKLASLRWAGANGITVMATTNDETNAPMLALNRQLGYRPDGRNVEYQLEW
jgi:GNAT superfamily N-acetyltransferase